MSKSLSQLPALSRLTEVEARAIEQMFRLYDYKSTGRIPSHLGRNLCQALGFDVALHNLPPNGTLRDILQLLDQRVPDPLPPLPGGLNSFVNLTGKAVDPEKKSEKFITADAINEFMESLGRPPISKTEADILLNGMLAFDDCSSVAAVPTADFVSDMSTYARKNNAIKDML